MIDGQKVGCGIVTYNRPALLKKLYDSLPTDVIDSIVIINDGDMHPEFSAYGSEEFFNNERNLGVGKSKNRALSRLMDAGCEHLFLIEDDIYIKSPEVFELYVLTSTLTGIQHLNYSQHGLMNKTPTGEANAVCKIDYGNGINLPLYRHCVGAFSYYSRRSLDAAGLMDEAYHNAFEHVDHTLAIINQNMHPPFWFFADIDNSELYLGDEPWTLETSTISSNTQHRKNALEAIEHFTLKHGCSPIHHPLASNQELMDSLNSIKQNFGLNI
ncbi:glycosyltransferase subfamily GT2 protein [Pseudomonas syringae]|uniref:glycosyltransferase family 2 protein n=1 Tax=Pseudomonas syringae TaxID=317 RepID=UPI001CA9561F|nr:glycosyltransferase subfamily GT2 protein [Pseudomonas syringae]MCI3944739.1 glycosyltransferase subfamily GT2 protein [Pseudomonas syringae]